MGIKILVSGIWVAGVLAQALVAEPPAQTSHAHSAGQRVVLSPGPSYLGVAVVEIPADRAKELHLKDERGVEVTCVDEGSPAAKAGLKPGDVVLEYNGERVEGGEQFIRLVRETPPGRMVSLAITREGSAQNLTATIGQRKSDPMFAFGGEEFSMNLPPVPPMTFHMTIPDLPHAFMSWRSSTL